MRKKKRKGPKPPRVCPGHSSALLLEGDVGRAALECGLNLRVSAVRAGRHELSHWMFDCDGARVLNYWPSNGKVWAPRSNYKGKVKDPWAALEEAKRAALGEVGEVSETASSAPSQEQKTAPIPGFVGWARESEASPWKVVVRSESRSECFRVLAPYGKRNFQCFVTDGRGPDEVFAALESKC